MMFHYEYKKLCDFTYNILADSGDIAKELQARAEEREESMLRGVWIEPVIVNQSGLELMDGYTRYTVLKKHRQTEVYAYVGKKT